MAGGRIDPRYDPRFQRGYTPPPDDGGRDDQREADGDAEGAAPRPRRTPPGAGEPAEGLVPPPPPSVAAPPAIPASPGVGRAAGTGQSRITAQQNTPAQQNATAHAAGAGQPARVTQATGVTQRAAQTARALVAGRARDSAARPREVFLTTGPAPAARRPAPAAPPRRASSRQGLFWRNPFLLALIASGVGLTILGADRYAWAVSRLFPHAGAEQAATAGATVAPQVWWVISPLLMLAGVLALLTVLVLAVIAWLPGRPR